MGGVSTRIHRPIPSTVSPADDPIGYISSCILKRDYRRCKKFVKKGTWMKEHGSGHALSVIYVGGLAFRELPVVQQQTERARSGQSGELRIMDLPLHLMFAVSQNGLHDRSFLRFLRLLLDYGYDPDVMDEKGAVALHAALMRVNFFSVLVSVRLLRRREVYTTRFVLALCQSGANVNIHETRANRTPLHYAAKCNLNTCVEILLEYGALIEAQDIEEKTALSLAAESAAVESVRCLLENMANVHVSSQRGQTPLHRAVNGLPTSRAERCVQMLLAAGADPNVKDINGNTPLHLAARGRAEGSIVHQLLLYEADPSILNMMHHSVLYEYLIAFSIPDTLDVQHLTMGLLESYPGFKALMECTPRSPRMVRDIEGQTLSILNTAALKPLQEQFVVEDLPQSLQYMCRQVIRNSVGVAPMVYFPDMVKDIGLPPLLEKYVCSDSYRNAMRAPGLILRAKN